MTYAQYKARVETRGDEVLAELSGLQAATYADQVPPFYAHTERLRLRFEYGFRRGRQLLAKEKRT